MVFHGLDETGDHETKTHRWIYFQLIQNLNSEEKLYSFLPGRNILNVCLQLELVPGLKRRLKSNLGSDQCSDSPWRQKLASPSSSLLCQDQAFMVLSLIGFEYHGTSTKGNPTGVVAITLPVWDSWSELCQRQLACFLLKRQLQQLENTICHVAFNSYQQNWQFQLHSLRGCRRSLRRMELLQSQLQRVGRLSSQPSPWPPFALPWPTQPSLFSVLLHKPFSHL